MKNQVVIEKLKECSQTDLEDLGRLLSQLSSKYQGAVVSKDQLQAILDSPSAVIIIARLDGRIVGMATVSVIYGVASGPKAELEDFVTDAAMRGQGLGSKIWDEVIAWCQKEQLKSLNFTSNSSRQAAHEFYLKRGAKIRDTSVFRVEL